MPLDAPANGDATETVATIPSLSSSPKPSSNATQPQHRRRSSSIVISHVEPETIEDQIDQQALPNLNANWVHAKGAWLIHIVIICLLRMTYNLIPFITPEWAWTLTNITYVIGSYIMFHQIKGTPFEFNSGAFDNLTMWEQIDDGDQYTPVKKFLVGVPIGLFLVSTHYTHYDSTLFVINLIGCLILVIPKLPSSHRLRVILPFVAPPPGVKQ